MTRRSVALAAAALALQAMAAPTASAQTAPIGAARLQGTFQLAGRVTAAVNVAGEHRGQTVSRIWTFTPQCPAGPCTSVLLNRTRKRGRDTLLLTERSPGHYAGTGRFYAPLRCRGRINSRGELVPFVVTVTITHAIVAGGQATADRVNATYMNPRRRNLTRCVEPPSHDAATYHGHLIQSG